MSIVLYCTASRVGEGVFSGVAVSVGSGVTVEVGDSRVEIGVRDAGICVGAGVD
jgi:hypothetical protein